MRLSLTTRFSLIIGGVLLLAVIASLLATLSARRVANLMVRTATEHVPSVRAGAKVEIALLARYNYLALYTFGDPGPEHLADLEEARKEFDRWYREARRTALTLEETQLLGELDSVHSKYRVIRNQVVSLRASGRVKEAQSLVLGELRDVYRQAFSLCEQLVAANERYVNETTAKAVSESQRMTWIVSSCVVATLTLGGGLLWYFLAAVVLPLRRMMARSPEGSLAGEPSQVPQAGDELKAVAAHIRGLMADVAESRSAVADSRRRMLSAEKLAGVGRLAASVAHEIRNPLTAVKMLLFSIRKAVESDPEIARKLLTVTEEIHRLENIVRNFLEFSRPPCLKVRPQPLGELLDRTLQLFQPRMAKNGIRLVRRDAAGVPDVVADSEQFKQVLLNLLENAAEAMDQGGCITISTAVDQDAAGATLAIVRIEDAGHGMPDDVQRRLFEPFFTTKADGTGLGLCIAGQIMAAHHGRLVLESSTESGTRFAAILPTVESTR
jgi:signal transduction histidine kinase